jgi:heat shock protein HtpX
MITILFRFSLSRKREYLADAGSAELTRNPHALASALRKISGDPTIEAVERKDIAQMFIENPQIGNKKFKVSASSLFATHPPIQKRIEILEQF